MKIVYCIIEVFIRPQNVYFIFRIKIIKTFSLSTAEPYHLQLLPFGFAKLSCWTRCNTASTRLLPHRFIIHRVLFIIHRLLPRR